MLKRFLNKGSAPDVGKRCKPPLKLVPRPITVTELRQLIPLRNLSEEELNAFSLTQAVEAYGPGSILFEKGEQDAHVLFLLAGNVTMKISDEQHYQVAAGTTQANFPLSHGESHNATAIAETDVEVLRVSAKVMHKNFKVQLEEDHLLNPDNWEVPSSLRGTPLYQTFCQNFLNEELKLPTLPDIAFRLRKVIEKDDIGVAEAAKIIQLDATIAAKLIHIANSPLYMAAQPARHSLEAINRLGLKATCHLVMSLCLKDVFKSKDRYLNRKMHQLWRESLEVSALAYVLAKHNQWPDPEEALLMGLICDIGAIPFLSFVSDFPKEHYQPEDVDAVLSAIRGPAGYYVLKRWEFPEELVNIPLLVEMWHYDNGEALTLSDIVMLSKLHHRMETGRMDEVPSLNSIPACGKLRDGSLSPEYSLRVLHESKDQIQEMLTLLR